MWNFKNKRNIWNQSKIVLKVNCNETLKLKTNVGRIWFYRKLEGSPAKTYWGTSTCTHKSGWTLCFFEHYHNTGFLATARGPAFWAGHSSSCFEPGFPHLRLSPFFLRKPLELSDSHVPISMVDTHALEEAPCCRYKLSLLQISIISKNDDFNLWANRWDM